MPKPTSRQRTSPGQYVSYQAQHPPLFYVLAAVVYRGVIGLGSAATWYVLRTLCALCGCFVLLLAVRAANLSFPGCPFIGLAMLPFIAFLPMFGYEMGNLSNEPLASALGAWAWLQMARLIRKKSPITHLDGIKLGLTLGLAAMTRLTTLLWLPAAAIVLTYCVWRDRDLRRLVPMLLCGVCFLAVVAPWLVHNELAYGSLFIRSADRPTLQGTSLDQFIANPEFTEIALLTALWYVSTAWTPFWLAQFSLPGGLQAVWAWQSVFLIPDILALVALSFHAVRSKRNREADDIPGRVLLWAAGAALFFCVLVVLEQQLYSDKQIILYAGRYLLDALPVSALLFLFACSTCFRNSQKTQITVATVIAVIMLAFDLYTISLVRAFYNTHTVQDMVQRP